MYVLCIYPKRFVGRHGSDRMVVGFTTTCAISASQPITTNVVNSNPVHGKVHVLDTTLCDKVYQ